MTLPSSDTVNYDGTTQTLTGTLSGTNTGLTFTSTAAATPINVGTIAGGTRALSVITASSLVITGNVADSSVAFQADSNGSGGKNITFVGGATIAANSQTYQAGNGSGSSTVSFTNGTFQGTAGSGTSPMTFIYKQDGNIANTEPGAAQYGSGLPTNLTIQSLNSATSIAASASNVRGTNLTVAAKTTINLPNLTGPDSLTSLQATATTIQVSSITTTAAAGQTYTGTVQLTGTGLFTLDASGATGGFVTINGGVTGSDASGSFVTLEIDSGSSGASSITGAIVDTGGGRQPSKPWAGR